MKYNLPSFESCLEVCNHFKNFNFFFTKSTVDNFDIYIFNYRLCDSSMFNLFECITTEMRGITFVFNADGSIYHRYILMHKFFNLNQEPTSQYNLLKNLTLKEISNKEDGSLISFIKLPNGHVLSKSKGSILSDQAISAMKIYEENIYIHKFVDYTLNNNIIAMFEFVSPTNRIVLPYTETKLILTQLRDNNTGEYLNISDYKHLLENISIAETFNNLTLDELISNCETAEGIEGYVIRFENDKFIKLKSKEYFCMHQLHTEDLYREDAIISLIIDEKIDDILCQLADGDERKIMVEELITITNNHIIRTLKETTELLDKYKGDKKDFAIRYRKDNNFKHAMYVLNQNGDLPTHIKDTIKKDTYFLAKARNWIKKEKEL